MRAAVAILAAFSAVHLALGCAGGYRGTPPEGHPGIGGSGTGGGRRLATAGADVWPCKGTMACSKALRDYGGVFSPHGPWAPGQPVTHNFLHRVANISATLGKDLCYWSQQTLPPPQNSSGESEPPNEFDAARVMNIYGELATSRLQAMITKDGPVQFVGCAYGSVLRQAQCNFRLNTSYSCSPPVNKQYVKYPVSSVMFKITPETIDEIADIVYTWRTTMSGHTPNMHAVVAKGSGAYGWGQGGGLFAKIVPCGDLPDGILKQSHACDEVNAKSGRIFADEWFGVWEGLCNIYEDPAIPSTLESCKPKGVIVV
eukprot:CAMPEP_0204585436 /NCGR_PEP_ID=MMETSP0661-20131031/46915_1 /ASSEMBLY_ACC=CAM_ASM_000606 /TAXON_ID=109239 /ORGANISM="Alexandrium margalefi, Strain AMGDE01CS-322" /LENGTH=313 /DNA_ID=CAMNT_0051594993 /DNA_START=61 /DNA_END=1002 /DNA_ORIENTATION=+